MGRADSTREAIADSYLSLLSSRSGGRITVADISRGCGITPQTFYNHFGSRYEMIAWIYTRFVESALERVGLNGYTMGAFLLETMRFFIDNRLYMVDALTRSKGSDRVPTLMEDASMRILTDEIRRRTGEEPSRFVIDLVRGYCYGTCGLVRRWLVEEPRASPEEIARACEELVPSRISALFDRFYKQPEM